MENEMLKIFDGDRNEIGKASREEVHRLGLWHETFHCWIIGREKGKDYIYLQIRSDSKKDYPGLLDITAAGHLLANETVRDGIREVEEELGISVSFQELLSLGIIDYSVTSGNLIDKELANVFFYDCSLNFDDFSLQVEEVSGIVRVEFKQFEALWLGELEEVHVEGFNINLEGKRVSIKKMVTRNNFVPHENSYYEMIVHGIKENLGH
ncbi:NUDIX hydrolase [Psychrobacillus glaciei]|uniref:NUDIX hydrolase n=1 Tax=Psychrobacillus glaciei TaxID=2283160 RepID=A0A5J6SQN3_9BACI|nr:NUDIX domain-containing protein [Psychrobacillus glaciei]QFG00241.1 NUDIX hydrolase [Psychrobacillus glaciei]